MKKRILTDIEPRDVFKYFEDMTFIPRESGNEQEISDYLVDFAKQHGLDYIQDEFLNVVISKPASAGYEDHPGVILQGHMDMVCEKNRDYEHDFAKDPIEFEIEDGDIIIAKNTTLGADDGIGVAFGLAALADDNLKHPALELVCTTDEERGMSGIENFDFSVLKGDRVINLDSNDEGVIVVGCAGGPVVRVELPIQWIHADEGKTFIEITLRGLTGGHSGEDIHRGRANANKLLVRMLMALRSQVDYQLADISGGLKYNAIPRNAECVVAVDKDKADIVKQVVAKYDAIYKEEGRVNDPDVALACSETESHDTVLDEESKMRVLDYISFSDTGIVRRDMDYPQFVESSVSLGVVGLKGDIAEIWTMTRSSRRSQYEFMFEKIVGLTEHFGGTYEVMSNCPEWEYDYQSELKEIFARIYKEQSGKDASVSILHAGVEPGEFSKNIPRKLDMISIGPDARRLHSPGENLSISSTQRVWDTFKKLLEAL